MAVILEDRPIETLREEVIDTLIYNYSHGVISNEAFERRLDQAMASQNHQEIVDLAGDLEKNTDSEFTSQKERQFNINYAASDNDETETIVNILGGSCRSGQWKVPREIRIITLFGGADIDFTDAIFTTPNVTIKILCLFGGTDISIPEDINVYLEDTVENTFTHLTNESFELLAQTTLSGVGRFFLHFDIFSTTSSRKILAFLPLLFHIFRVDSRGRAHKRTAFLPLPLLFL
jgi:hypothetical protein